MSFNRLDPSDFVVSSDSITATLWTGASPTLNTFFTSSVQEAGSSGDYYLKLTSILLGKYDQKVCYPILRTTAI